MTEYGRIHTDGSRSGGQPLIKTQHCPNCETQAAEVERLRAEAEAHYDRGYYDGYTYLLEQHEALREALGAAPLIGLTESVNDFMARRNAWLNGPYRAALEQSK